MMLALLHLAPMWIFSWQLIAGGSQYSDPYPTQSDCESARLEVLATGKSPLGLTITSTKECVRIR
jgi:hypothetical protein